MMPDRSLDPQEDMKSMQLGECVGEESVLGSPLHGQEAHTKG